MLYNNVLLAALALSTGFVEVAFAQGGGRGGQGRGQGGAQPSAQPSGQGQQGQQQNASQQATSAAQQAGVSATLDGNALQTASQQDGQGGGAQGVKAGQAKANTDPANFINVCAGKTLTNGQQTTTGSCNGIPMGDIPSTDNMVSTILTNPAPGQDIAANQDFQVKMQVANLNAGVFTNPTVTYYSAPQALDPNNNNIIGHVHVTIQTLGPDLAPQQAPDPKTFVFFKGIDDAGDGKGGLTADVTGGLPAGNYRVCTMSASATHQPVTMPVAQRGAQDDCTKFTVGGGGNAAPGTTTEVAKPAAATAPAASQSAAAAAGDGSQAGAEAGAQAGAQEGKRGAAAGGRQDRKGQRKQVQWGARRHRFQSRPYVA